METGLVQVKRLVAAHDVGRAINPDGSIGQIQGAAIMGLGEAAMLPTAPAIINGISRALGHRIRQIPATPERVLKAIRASQAQGTTL